MNNNIYGVGKSYDDCFSNKYYTDIEKIFTQLDDAKDYAISNSPNTNMTYKIFRYILDDKTNEINKKAIIECYSNYKNEIVINNL